MKLKTIILSLLAIAFVATAHAQTKPIKSRHQATQEVRKSKKTDATVARKQTVKKKRIARKATNKNGNTKAYRKAKRLKNGKTIKPNKNGAARKAVLKKRKSRAQTH